MVKVFRCSTGTKPQSSAAVTVGAGGAGGLTQVAHTGPVRDARSAGEQALWYASAGHPHERPCRAAARVAGIGNRRGLKNPGGPAPGPAARLDVHALYCGPMHLPSRGYGRTILGQKLS